MKLFKKKRFLKKGEKPVKRYIVTNLLVALIIGVATFFYTKSATNSITVMLLAFGVPQIYIYSREKLKESAKTKKMELVFPDFLQLMASNLRAGMTIDRSLILSSRKEFAPLDKEIFRVGKDILTGTEISKALLKMSERINSEKIEKTINLIISGIRSGGNLAILLEQTATSTRERNFVEKRAASNVLMYVIFIFFAIAVGAPVLFSLSSILVQVLTDILSNIPVTESVNTNLPFALSKINISVKFITYFSATFLIAMDILGALIIGLVSKGEEKEGLKYIFPLIGISLTVFFATRIILLSYLKGGIIS